MSRINRHEMFMEIAESFAKRGTCARGSNGCLIVDLDNNILSHGYNGPPPGHDHCTAGTCNWGNIHLIPCQRSIHAEINAINRYKKQHSKTGDIVFYITSTPCEACTKAIIEVEPIIIFYRNLYHTYGHLRHLEEAGIKLCRVLPNYLVGYNDGLVTEI